LLLSGCPPGYRGSVNGGIVSAAGRAIELPGGVTRSGTIQANAAGRQENSGGRQPTGWSNGSGCTGHAGRRSWRYVRDAGRDVQEVP